MLVFRTLLRTALLGIVAGCLLLGAAAWAAVDDGCVQEFDSRESCVQTIEPPSETISYEAATRFITVRVNSLLCSWKLSVDSSWLGHEGCP